MMRACAERAKMKGVCGWSVRAWRTAGIRAQERGEEPML